MSDFYDSRPQPLDQAHGLRRLFGASRVRFLAVASNPHVAFSGVMLERLATACTEGGRRVLVVDAGESSPPAHELATLDLASCIEPLSHDTWYLAGRGLPLRHVDTRGSCAAFLEALTGAAPQADVVLLHAGASELGRTFGQRAVRPLLLAADHPDSVTHAYASMKLLALRHGLMAFDLLLGVAPRSVRRERIAQQLSRCADDFLGAVLHDWADIDPACAVDEPPRPALVRLVHALLEPLAEPLPAPARPHPLGAAALQAN